MSKQAENPQTIGPGTPATTTADGELVSVWRRGQRERLLASRLAAGEKRKTWNTVIDAALRPLLPQTPGTIVGVYWPFKGEFAVRGLMRELHEQGARPALPRVAQPRHPLEFRLWHPDAEMVQEVYDIPVPKNTPVVTPEVLIIPLVGFDAAGYRLGYGGGYYDRTIASITPRPLLIGVGFELSRLDTIYPQPHDIPMDYVVTENGVSDYRGQR